MGNTKNKEKNIHYRTMCTQKTVFKKIEKKFEQLKS